MTSPSDFLDIERLHNEGNPNHERIEEQWDEPERPEFSCLHCEAPMETGPGLICEVCLWVE